MMKKADLVRLVDRIKASNRFDERWYLSAYPDVPYSNLEPIEHYLRIGAWLGREPSPDFDTDQYLRQNPEVSGAEVIPFVHSIIRDDPEERVKVEKIRAVSAPSVKPLEYATLALDEAYYMMHNPDVASSGMQVRNHFDMHGCHELRNPNADFDIWWYTQNYLLGTKDQDSNALEHYNRVGAELGHLPRPPLPVSFDTSYSHPLPEAPRRVCLFAAYDGDGIVDDYVLDYLRDMARHADVYYLADCPMDETEMAKLNGLVKGAWAQRHGMYDFGSYSILARDLVGWDVIETYDELILANDSCYRVHPLADTFAKMDARPCAWWGLQATRKRIGGRMGPRSRLDCGQLSKMTA